jgi:hypothetical protein
VQQKPNHRPFPLTSNLLPKENKIGQEKGVVLEMVGVGGTDPVSYVLKKCGPERTILSG